MLGSPLEDKVFWISVCSQMQNDEHHVLWGGPRVDNGIFSRSQVDVTRSRVLYVLHNLS